MKTTSRILLTTLCAFATAFAAHAGPIGKGGFTISKPGKYMLIRNITIKPKPGTIFPLGISIEANDVELDLGGFTIGPAPGLEGLGIGIVLSPTVQRVHIHNGHIQGVQQGIGTGVASTISSCILEQIQIADCSGDGIVFAGTGNLIRSCVITRVADGHQGIGIKNNLTGVNEVTDCSVIDGGGQTIGISSGGGDGLLVRHCVVQGCEEGFHVSIKCKLFNNVTLFCTNPITGSPILAGVND